MTFKEYQIIAWNTALPTTQNLNYMALGLGNEAGEVLGKIKKFIRLDPGWDKEEVAGELGDVLWYVAGLAKVLGLDLGTIAAGNIAKLLDRQQRGVLQGNGDTR